MKHLWKSNGRIPITRRDEDIWANTWYFEEAIKNISGLRDLQKQYHDDKNLWLQLTREFGSWEVIFDNGSFLLFVNWCRWGVIGQSLEAAVEGRAGWVSAAMGFTLLCFDLLRTHMHMYVCTSETDPLRTLPPWYLLPAIHKRSFSSSYLLQPPLLLSAVTQQQHVGLIWEPAKLLRTG